MRTDPPAGLLEAFRAYERALGTDDLDALDRLFAPGPETLRGDATGLLVGHERIAAFRGARGGAPARRLVEVHVRTVDDDHALVVAVTELLRGGRGPSCGNGDPPAGWWSPRTCTRPPSLPTPACGASWGTRWSRVPPPGLWRGAPSR